MSRKRKALCIETKMQILRDVDSGLKKKGVASKYGIPPNTLSTIIKARENIEESFYNGGVSSARKKLRKCPFPDVEVVLLSWFKDVRARNLPVSGALLQKKANDFAFLLGHGIDDFCASSGWLQRMRRLHFLKAGLSLAMEVPLQETTHETQEPLPTNLWGPLVEDGVTFEAAELSDDDVIAGVTQQCSVKSVADSSDEDEVLEVTTNHRISNAYALRMVHTL